METVSARLAQHVTIDPTNLPKRNRESDLPAVDGQARVSP